MLPDVDDAICWIPFFVFLGVVFRTPRVLGLVPMLLSTLGTHNIRIRIDGSELSRVGLCEGYQFPANGLKVGRVVEEQLEEHWRSGQQVIRLGSEGVPSPRTKLRSHFFSL